MAKIHGVVNGHGKSFLHDKGPKNVYGKAERCKECHGKVIFRPMSKLRLSYSLIQTHFAKPIL